MEPQNPFQSKNDDQKTMQLKQVIDRELFWVQMNLIKIDQINASRQDKYSFVSSFASLWDDYTDLLQNKTDPERAKYILMKNLRDKLEIHLGLKTKEDPESASKNSVESSGATKQESAKQLKSTAKKQ